jgi:hypothetical protein
MSKNTNSFSNKDILEIIKPDDALRILRQLIDEMKWYQKMRLNEGCASSVLVG